jgi:hypothetical protein
MAPAPEQRKRWPAGDCSWEEAVGRFSSGEFGGELNHEQGLAAEFIQEVTIISLCDIIARDAYLCTSWRS